jgi:hypothetical protein
MNAIGSLQHGALRIASTSRLAQPPQFNFALPDGMSVASN